jgi:hypothetical protein
LETQDLERCFTEIAENPFRLFGFDLSGSDDLNEHRMGAIAASYGGGSDESANTDRFGEFNINNKSNHHNCNDLNATRLDGCFSNEQSAESGNVNHHLN